MARDKTLTYLITLPAVIILLSAVFSCSDRRDAQVRQVLATADSLMMIEPQAALDTLMSIDSTYAGKLPRADRAFYTLLRTEAEYKCYLPVAENTAIAEAAAYYRRKGPEAADTGWPRPTSLCPASCLLPTPLNSGKDITDMDGNTPSPPAIPPISWNASISMRCSNLYTAATL